MHNYSEELWKNIVKQAEMNMDTGTCSLYRNIAIPMKVRTSGINSLKDWEKVFFLDGVKNKKWTIKGVQINGNPYQSNKLNENGN